MNHVGFGYDLHRLRKEEGELLLATCAIPSPFVVEAHSDGDVLLHALSNALLSSVGEEDIGVYFPDTSSATLNMSSLEILEFSLAKVKEKGYILNNAVVCINLEKPKLLPYRKQIKEKLCQLLSLDDECVSIQATTGEKLGPIGNSEALCCYATVLVSKE